jgi:hypothetical protein
MYYVACGFVVFTILMVMVLLWLWWLNSRDAARASKDRSVNSN